MEKITLKHLNTARRESTFKTILTVVQLSSAMIQNDDDEILLKQNVHCAIKVIRENKK